MTSSANYGYDDGSDHTNHMALDVDEQVRKGPWTEEEDSMLASYISVHGEGHWNTLARSAGLRRTGKSCRLRWLNYLRPNVRRGNITLQEQLLILQLHSRWGNRWSKIAQELPGRTDNEIKNYWRTRVQKQAKQLKCDINSKQFRDTMRFVWMPRLEERIQAAAAAANNTSNDTNTNTSTTRETRDNNSNNNSSESASWDTQVSPVSELTECCNNVVPGSFGGGEDDYFGEGMLDWEAISSSGDGSVTLDNIVWNEENFWFLQQQLYD